MSNSLRELVAAGGVFQGYVYGYPHKTAYRQLSPPRALAEAWATEDKANLFLYVHLPFCEMRCGFCNLFTMARPEDGLINSYLHALERQAAAVAAVLGSSSRFSRLAIGGGTPTFLSTPELARLFALLNQHLLGFSNGIPRTIEASPATMDSEKAALLREHGITRVSLGVQSFLESEVRALGRAQRACEVSRALEILRSAGFSCLNLDLMYGMAGQTVFSWQQSLQEALAFAPQELYLYPLYVRPLTHLGRTRTHITDLRLALYRAGRDFLLEHGYRQISMRLFRSADYLPAEGPVYCCQEDSMVGLGAGARSYTRALHYSSEYALGRQGTLAVITDFNHRGHEQFQQADYGYELDVNEQKRRYILKSLLRADGLDLTAYGEWFSQEVFADFPELQQLLRENLAVLQDGHLMPTARGMELSDVIGPWLWSSVVRDRMSTFILS